jgi:hypothetical protein
MPMNMGKKPIKLIKDGGRIKLIKEAIILINISVENPRYWPSTTLRFEKALLLKKDARRIISSRLVAIKADTDMVINIKVCMGLF